MEVQIKVTQEHIDTAKTLARINGWSSENCVLALAVKDSLGNDRAGNFAAGSFTYYLPTGGRRSVYYPPAAREMVGEFDYRVTQARLEPLEFSVTLPDPA
jgi:hypothetical protein